MEAVTAIAHILRREGVEFIFNFPDNRIIEPAAEQGIRPMQARAERTAVGMADGYTRVSNGRRIGVVMTQFGPGIEAAFGGVAAAYADATPILIISANLSERRYGHAPEFDPIPNYRHITKWAARFTHADAIPQVLRYAFTLLRSGRPGPVLLDLPLEVGRADVPDELVDAYVPVRAPRTLASSDDIDACIEALRGAASPVLHVGQGVLYAEATAELVELAEALGIPVVTTLSGKGAFPEDHRLALGSGGGSWPDMAQQVVGDADLVIGIGCSFADAAYSMPIPTHGKTLIQVVHDERDFNKDIRIDHLVQGDARLVLRQLLERIRSGAVVPAPGADERAQRLAEARATWESAWASKFASDEVPINPYRVYGALAAALDVQRSMITHDAGKPRDQLTPFWKTLAPRGYIGWGKSTPLGYGLALIMGAKLADPDRFATNVMGDAAIGMSGMDIETAVRLKIPIMTVVLDNGGMTNYEARYPVAAERYGFKYLTGDYGTVAKGLGAVPFWVDDPANLVETFRRAREAVEQGQVALVDVKTKEENEISNHR
jgi:acetolactate synthase-1/2/3 large subunit